uniref:Phage portal protein n=1 Tax=Thermus caliditerrae TaxID=1330700 RepID=A0A7C5VFT7_9DEIN
MPVLDIPTEIARLQLGAVGQRMKELETAWDIALGLYRPAQGELTPPPASPAGQEAFARIVQRVGSYGPRVLATLVNAAVGDVNWGGDSRRLDRVLSFQDLHALARGLAEDYVVSGVAAGYVYSPDGVTPRIGRIRGYVQAYLDPEDSDRVTGLYQAVQVMRGSPPRTGYQVRVWDLEERVARVWERLQSPTELARAPDRVVEGVVPRFRFYALHESGAPLSLFLQNLPMFLDLYTSDLYLARVEELSAYPIPVFGPETEVQRIGPGLPIRGEFRWERPGDLEELRRQRREKLERLRDAFALPGGFLGNDSPSGEALREANVRFYQQAQAIARAISGLLTELVADYARALGEEPVPVTVSPANAGRMAEVAQTVAFLYEKGLLPLRVAARELQPFFPTWSDEELEEWLQRQEGLVTPEQVARLLGGGEG